MQNLATCRNFLPARTTEEDQQSLILARQTSCGLNSFCLFFCFYFGPALLALVFLGRSASVNLTTGSITPPLPCQAVCSQAPLSSFVYLLTSHLAGLLKLEGRTPSNRMLELKLFILQPFTLYVYTPFPFIHASIHWTTADQKKTSGHHRDNDGGSFV